MNPRELSLRRFLYPPVCESCFAPLSANEHRQFPYLCETCTDGIAPISESTCGKCGQVYPAKMPPNVRCSNCRDRDFQFDFALGAYRSRGVLREMMHRYKYRRQIQLSRLFGKCLLPALDDFRLQDKNWLVVPVPLHRKRLRERGYNQSAEIATEWHRMLKNQQDQFLLKPLLRRVRFTERQATLDRDERIKNLKNAFVVSRRFRNRIPVESRFLIIDDVLTTGSTASECARVLREHFQPKEVAAIAVLRG